jgi:hypothetical protein
MIRSLTRNCAGPILTSLAAFVALLVAGTLSAAPEKSVNDATTAKPIDVVICLDVSNSMDGLMSSAKAKLWDIVNDLAKVKPTPNLRVALYSYGHNNYDKNAGWVRKDVDLITDLDLVYQKLNGLTTNGGEEYVARVCRDALDQQKWSEDKGALKLIFVCGNEPASQDPIVKLKDVAKRAIAKGVVINPIYCGKPSEPDARDWKEFAEMAKGQFASIDQDKGIVAIAAPQDKELAELSGKLNTTYLAYGKEGKDKQLNQVAQDSNAEKSGAGVAAARSYCKANGLYRNDAWDLVDRCKNDSKFDLKKLVAEELPEAMRKLKPEEREAYVKDVAAKRAKLQKEINDLAAKRQAYINEQMKKNPSAADKAFDAAIRGALRQQAAAKGIKIPE